jgi:ABC-type glycerol-3-phosphate transport system permease component
VSAVAAPAPARTAPALRRFALGRVGASLACFVIAAIYLVPFAWVLSLSIRDSDDVLTLDILPHSFRPGNFPDAWNLFSLGTLFMNTIVIAIGTVALTLSLSCMAAYGFARFRSRLSEAVFMMILLGLTVPPAAMIVPFFVLMHNLGLFNSRISVILAETAFSLPLGVLLMRSYVERLPFDVVDAARVDGARPFRAFRLVVIPLLRPGMATLALFVTLTAWNDLLLPLVLLPSADESTLTVGLATAVQSFGQVHLAALAAASVMAAVPVLTVMFALRRYYVDVLASTARQATKG